MTTVQNIYDFIDSIAPFATSAEWDNAGLLVGDCRSEVTGIVTALDVTTAVLDEAARHGCSLVVSHHPVIFSPIKSVLAGSVPYEAARRGISVICAHTNYDIADGGVNTILAQRLGLGAVEQLSATDPFGLRGTLPKAMKPAEFAAYIAERLGLAPHYNPCGRDIVSVGLCGGSGGDMLAAALDEGAALDAFVTADAKHHEFVDAATRGVTLYDAGHYATESPAMPALTKHLQLAFPATRVLLAECYSGVLLG